MGGDTDVWDRAYESGEYLAHWDYRHPSPELIAMVAARLVPAEGVALDIGCGAGREAIFLAQCGFRVIGVDISPKALAIARDRATAAGLEVDFRHGGVLQLPVEDQSIDFANDRGCFHHIAEDERTRYAEEVARVLKQGARLLLRGARGEGGEGFVAVTQETVDRHFSKAQFSHGPVLPILLVSDGGCLEAHVVVLQRR